jgi:hypothetical protein
VSKQLKFKRAFGKYAAAYRADVKSSGNITAPMLHAGFGFFVSVNHKQHIATSLCSLLLFVGLA